MIKNYIKIAFRNLYRNKVFSFINIVGLAIGLAVSFCIIIYVMHELSYDKHHENFDKIYRLDTYFEEVGTKLPVTSSLLANAVESIAEVNSVAKIDTYSGVIINVDNKEFPVPKSAIVNTEFFDVFSYKSEFGSLKGILNEMNNIIIKDSLAEKLFGTTDVLNKLIPITVNAYKRSDTTVYLKIAGVFSSFNTPNSINTDLFFSWNLIDVLYPYNKEHGWESNNIMTFLLIDRPETASIVESKIREIYKAAMKDDKLQPPFIQHLQQLGDSFKNYRGYTYSYLFPNIDIKQINLYLISAIVILLLASINFILISTAKFSTKFTEIGIRRVIGAGRKEIFMRVMFESVIISTLAFPVAYLFVEMILPYFTNWLSVDINTNYYFRWTFFTIALIITILVGFLSGSYTSFYTTKLIPIKILSGNYSFKSSKGHLRNSLVVFQIFVVSSLVIGSLVVNFQIKFMQNKDLGFNKENMLIVSIDNLENKKDVFINKLNEISGVRKYAGCSWTFPYDGGNFMDFTKVENPERKYNMGWTPVDTNYVEMLNLRLLQGTLKPERTSPRKVIINSSAASLLGFENPIGQIIKLRGQISREIIGVVKDFNFQSLHKNIEPLVMEVSDYSRNPTRLIVKLDGRNLTHTIEQIEKAYQDLSDSKFYFNFLDERFDELYKREIQFSSLIEFFTSSAIILGVLGLFGLVLFSVQQRTQEIGIRKVMGATVTNILRLLTKEFVMIVVVGSLIAFPVAYYLMTKWLNDFAYRITIGPEIFLYAFTITLAITLLTISIQAVKAAVANPVESLRDE